MGKGEGEIGRWGGERGREGGGGEGELWRRGEGMRGEA